MLKNKTWLIFLIISLFSLRWFQGEDFIYGGDGTWPLDFNISASQNKFVWSDSISMGIYSGRSIANFYPLDVIGVLGGSIGLTSGVIQRIIYVICFFFSGYGFYLLVSKLGAKRIPSFISGLFYMLSPFALIVVWNTSYGRIFPFYTFLPLMSYLFITYLRSPGVINKTFSITLLLGFFTFFGANFNNPAYFLLYIFVLFGFLIYEILEKQDTAKQLVLKSAIYVLTTLLLNSYWLLPFVADLRSVYESSDNVSGGLINDEKTQELNSVTIVDAFRFSGFWTMQAGHLDNFYYSFHEFWYTNTYIFSSFVMIIVLVFGLAKSQHRKSLATILLLFLLFILLNSGLKWKPFPELAESIYSIDYLGRTFRSVFLKFGTLLVFYPTIILGLVLSNFSKKITNLINLAIFSAILVNSAPFFTGEIIKPNDTNLPGYATSVPSEYFELKKFLGDSNDKRILVLPIPPSYNYHLTWEDNGINGAMFLRTFIHQQYIYLGTDRYVAEFAKNIDTKIVSDLGVDYILFHKDVRDQLYELFLTKSKPEIMSFIEKTGFSTELDTRYYTLYKNPNANYADDIFLVKDGITQSLNYEKLSPVEYTFKLEENIKDGTIVLRNNFHKGWELSGSYENSMFNNFANSWSGDFENGDYRIYLTLQKYLDIGLKLSILAVAILTLMYLFFGKLNVSNRRS